MGSYRVFAGSDGESHREERRVEEHPALGALTNIQAVRGQPFDGTRQRDFHPLPERRLLMPLSGAGEMGTSDGSRHVFRAGDRRLMADVTGRGHTHVDRSPSSAVYALLKDEDGGAGAGPARYAHGRATSDNTSQAIRGDGPQTLAEMHQEDNVSNDVDSRKHERIGRRVSNARLHVRCPTGR